MPQPEKTSKRRTGAGSIYAIGAVDSPYIKIGSTRTSVEQRLQSLQTGQPAKLHIVATHAVEADLHRIERQIHKFLATERHHGEWFACMLDAEALQGLILRAIDYLAAEDHATALEREKPKPLGKKSQELRPLNNRLTEYREARHLSRAELGALLGFSHVTIWRWETQTLHLSLEMLVKLAKFFEVSPVDLVPALEPSRCAIVPSSLLPPAVSPKDTRPTSSPDMPQLAWEW